MSSKVIDGGNEASLNRKSMSKIKFSIAMATYNGERFLKEQLDSLAAQIELPAELVVGDDGSTDRTIKILEEFSERAPFPVYIYRNKDRLGYADNFLYTASRCSNEWIFFCDQDDIWLPRKIERVQSIILAYPKVDFISAADIRIYMTPSAGWSRPLSLPYFRPPFHGIDGHNLAFKRTLLDCVRWKTRPFWNIDAGKTRRLTHDVWISMLGSLIGTPFHCKDRLTVFRRHGDAATFQAQSPLKGKFTNIDNSCRFYSVLSDAWREMKTWCLTESKTTSEPLASKLLLATARCENISRWYALRADMYRNSTPRTQRLVAFGRLILEGGYTSGLGMGAMIRDVAVGVISLGHGR